MRKTCRWLGCAAVLCFTAVELTGCTSKPLISGFKLPGRKDRDAAVAQKDNKPTAKDSEDLLAQAREYEKAGDFPNASRAYREYLNGGGQPAGPSRSPATPQVAKTKKTTNEKTVSLEEARSAEQSTPPKKAGPTITRKAVTAKPAEQSEDPWMDEPVKRPGSQTLPKIQPNGSADRTADVARSTPPAKPSAAPKSVAADKPAWAETDSKDSSPALEAATDASSPPVATRGLSQADLDDLLDLDEGAIDWGDEPDLPETAAVSSPPPVDEEVTETESPSADLPLVELDTASDDVMAPPVAEDSTDEALATSDVWHSHETAEDATIDESVADTSESEPLAEGVFAPPVFSDAEPATTTNSLVLLCKDCEPWVYAQVMKLESSSSEVRKEGLTNLAEMGSTARQAGAAVRTLLQDTDPLVQAHAAWAVWEIENDTQDSVGTLRPLLDHPNNEVVQLTCYMLGDIGAPAEPCADALELLRDHAEGTTRVHAAEALIRIQGADDKSVTILTTALKSRDGEERWIAAVALGRCRGENSSAAVTALTVALKDIDPEVRSAAALSLGGLGKAAEKASPELERVARMDDPQVRDAARAALACLKR